MSSAAARTAFVMSYQTHPKPVQHTDLAAANDAALLEVRKPKPSRLFRAMQNSAPEMMKIMPFWRP